MTLRDDDRRSVLLVVTQGHCDVRRIGDDDVRLFDALESALLCKRTRARLHTPFDLLVAVLLAHVLHEFLARHLHLLREAKAALRVVDGRDGCERSARRQDDVERGSDDPVDGDVHRCARQCEQVGELDHRRPVSDVADDTDT